MVCIRWKDVYVSARQAKSRKLVFFFSEDNCHPSLFSFTNKKSYIYCQVIKASWGDLLAVVFVSYKFVFLYVIARKRFLPQPDCSVITKVRDFSLPLYNYLVFKRINKRQKRRTLYIYKLGFSSATTTNLWSFSTWMSEVFTADFSDFSTTQAPLFAKHLHRFCSWSKWLEAQFQKF